MTRIKTVFWLRPTIDLEAADLLGRYKKVALATLTRIASQNACKGNGP